MPNPQQHPVPDQSLVDEYVETLSLRVDEHKFAQRLADTILRPVEDEHDAAIVLAFRDPRLINRSVAAANYLVNRANNDVKFRAGPDASNKDLAKRTAHYLSVVGRERQILKQVLDGEKAKRGILPALPNPRARAMEKLVSLNMRGDVPKGLFKQLLAQEEEKVRAAKKAAKDQARAAARAAKAGEAPAARNGGPRAGESSRSFSAQDTARARAGQGKPAHGQTRRGARAHH